MDWIKILNIDLFHERLIKQKYEYVYLFNHKTMYAAISCNVEAWDMDPAYLLFWGGKNAKHLFFQSEKSTLSLVFTVKKAKHPHFF